MKMKYILLSIRIKLHGVWISNGSERLRWFERDLIGFETETCQESSLQNLLYRGSEKGHKKEAKVDEETEEDQDAPASLVTH